MLLEASYISRDSAQVLVFRTSVQSPEEVESLAPLLNSLPGVAKWNFALDDSDRILRVVSGAGRVPVMDALFKSGFWCEELED